MIKSRKTRPDAKPALKPEPRASAPSAPPAVKAPSLPARDILAAIERDLATVAGILFQITGVTYAKQLDAIVNRKHD